MTRGAILGLTWLLAALLMAAGFVWQQRRRNAGIVDVLWATGLACGALLAGIFGGGALAPRLLVAAGGALWGTRLASHLWHRVSAEPEDGRYRYLRGRWGDAPLRWALMFQAQALLVALFSVPFVIAASNPAVRAAWLAAAAVVFACSVVGETLADRQLARFRADPANRGRTCRFGLWRYSRHPNYFFEWLHWFTYPLIAIGAPGALLAWLAPALMYLFLRYLSGIPFTEAQALRSRGDDYRDYQRRTSILVPWPPREPAPAIPPPSTPRS